eukprot:411054_1
MTLVPCGHIVCNPCIHAWRKEKSNATCPQCRNPIQNVIINRGLMDVIEENKQKNDVHLDNTQRSQPTRHVLHKSNVHKLMPQARTTHKRDRSNEVLHDKCESVIYIIDNSGSMENYNDGKIFTTTDDGTIIKRSGVVRWGEAASKVKKIAKKK